TLSLGFRPESWQLPRPSGPPALPTQLPMTAPSAVCACTVTGPPWVTPRASLLAIWKLTVNVSLVRARVPAFCEAVVPVIAVVLGARTGVTGSDAEDAAPVPTSLVAATVKV